MWEWLGNKPPSFLGPCVIYYRQAYGRAYGTGRSHARSPRLQHRPQLAGGVAPEPPFITYTQLIIRSSLCNLITFFIHSLITFSIHHLITFYTSSHHFFHTLSYYFFRTQSHHFFYLYIVLLLYCYKSP